MAAKYLGRGGYLKEVGEKIVILDFYHSLCCAIFAQDLNTKAGLYNNCDKVAQLDTWQERIIKRSDENMILNFFGKSIKILEKSEEQKREIERKEVVESWKFWKQGGI